MDEIKQLFLAAIGGAVLTYDKAEATIKELVKRGRITVEEGRSLSQDLKQRVSQFGQGQNLSGEELKTLLTEQKVAYIDDVKALEERVAELEAQVTEMKANR